jgi:hypothetical protein
MPTETITAAELAALQSRHESMWQAIRGLAVASGLRDADLRLLDRGRFSTAEAQRFIDQLQQRVPA